MIQYDRPIYLEIGNSSVCPSCFYFYRNTLAKFDGIQVGIRQWLQISCHGIAKRHALQGNIRHRSKTHLCGQPGQATPNGAAIWNDRPFFRRPIFLAWRNQRFGRSCCVFFVLFFFGGGRKRWLKSMDHPRTGPRKWWKMAPSWSFAFAKDSGCRTPAKKGPASFYGFENGGDPNHVSKSWDDPPSKTSEPHRILNFVARW